MRDDFVPFAILAGLVLAAVPAAACVACLFRRGGPDEKAVLRRLAGEREAVADWLRAVAADNEGPAAEALAMAADAMGKRTGDIRRAAG